MDDSGLRENISQHARLLEQFLFTYLHFFGKI